MAGFLPTVLVGAYNASKFAVLAFTEVLYHEHINSNIRFACVCPPPVATPLLKQGHDTVWPKTLDQAPPIEPQEVWNAIEAALDKNQFMVFPGKGTKMVWRLRRWLPGMIWKNIHKIEEM
jgi:short-subunit dehydrogenase